MIGNAPHNHEPQYHTAGFRVVHTSLLADLFNVLEACVTKINIHME